jgi:hypothetical protein
VPHDARQRHELNGRRTFGKQNFQTFLNRRTRCHYIVDKKNIQPGHTILPLGPNFEYTPYVV